MANPGGGSKALWDAIDNEATLFKNKRKQNKQNETKQAPKPKTNKNPKPVVEDLFACFLSVSSQPADEGFYLQV